MRIESPQPVWLDDAEIVDDGKVIWLGSVELPIDYGTCPEMDALLKSYTAKGYVGTSLILRGNLRVSATGGGSRKVAHQLTATAAGNLSIDFSKPDANTAAVRNDIAKARRNTRFAEEIRTTLAAAIKLRGTPSPDSKRASKQGTENHGANSIDLGLPSAGYPERDLVGYNDVFSSPLFTGAIDSAGVQDVKQRKTGEAPSNIAWSGKGVRILPGAFNPKYVWLGLSRLPILKSVEYHAQAGTGSIPVPRQTSAKVGATWVSEEALILTVEFPNTLLNDDGTVNENYNQVSELRTLIAQLRVTPFLPIQWGKRATASVMDIDAIAVEQVIISTVENYPGLYTLQIVGSPFNWAVYLKDKDKTSFADYFVWPAFHAYVQYVAEKVMPSQTYPTDGLRITLADETRISNIRKFVNVSTMGDEDTSALTPPSTADVQKWMKDLDADVKRNHVSYAQASKTKFKSPEEVNSRPGRCGQLQRPDWTPTHLMVDSYIFFKLDSPRLCRDPKLRSVFSKYVAVRVTDPTSAWWMNNAIEDYNGGRLNSGDVYGIRDEGWGEFQVALGEARKALDVAQTEAALANGSDLLATNREELIFPGMTTGTVQVVMTHRLSKLSSPGYSVPTMQYWGSPDIRVSLSVASNFGLENLKEAYQRSLAQRRRYKPLITSESGIEPGFWELQLDLLGWLGMRYFVPRSITPRTVEGMARREEARIDLDVFTTLTDQDLNDARKLTAGKFADPSPIKSGNFMLHDIDTTATVEAMTEIEERLATIPLYPDLYLPTYGRLRRWCEKLREMGYPISFSRPDGTTDGYYVDPDFYINSSLPEDGEFLDTKLIVETATQQLTLTGRQKDEVSVTVGPPSAPAKAFTCIKKAVTEAATYVTSAVGEAAGVVKDAVTGAAEVVGSGVSNAAAAGTTSSSDPAVAAAAAGDGKARQDVANAASAVVTSKPPENLESPEDKDPVAPISGEVAARGMFHDFLWQTPLNRLVQAFPTFLTIFYREGRVVGVKRLWDQYYGRAAVFSVSVVNSMYRADTSAVFSIADPHMGIATADLDATIDILDGNSRKSDIRWDGSPGSHIVQDVEAESILGQAKRTYSDMAGLYEGLTSWRPSEETVQRWKDLSNALVIASGTRVHIRAGYGSRTHLLPTIFNGSISEVEISPEALKVMAAGDGIELDNELLRRSDVTKGEKAEPNPVWEWTQPREWLLATLGSYQAASFLSAAKSKLLGSERVIGENKYGIYHLGNPIPIGGGQLSSEFFNGEAIKNAFSWTPLISVAKGVMLPRWINTTELGQNIYSSFYAEYDNRTISQEGPPTPDSTGGVGGVIPKIKESQEQGVILGNIGADIAGQAGAGVAAMISGLTGIPMAQAAEKVAAALGRRAGALVGGVQGAAAVGGSEDALTINIAGKTFWEIATELARCTPGYVCAVRPFGISRSTVFWGKPHWPCAYTYVRATDKTPKYSIRSGLRNTDPRATVWEKMEMWRDSGPYEQLSKVFSQMHVVDTYWNLVYMGMKTSSENVFTRCRVYGLNKSGEWIESGSGASVLPGEQVLAVQVDEDLYPECQRDMDIATPFRWKFGSPTYARKKAEHYAQERLSEACRTMYDGHIIILGNGSINPWDNLRVTDALTQTKGVCVVREVVHHIGMDTGFVTDIKPGAPTWGAIASSNTQVLSVAYGISSVLAGVMDVASVDQMQKLTMIRFGRSQGFRALQSLENMDIEIEDQSSEIRDAVADLARAYTTNDILKQYARMIKGIAKVLVHIRDVGVEHISMSRGQVMSVPDVVLQLGEIIRRLKGTHDSESKNAIGIDAVVSTGRGVTGSATGGLLDRYTSDVNRGRVLLSRTNPIKSRWDMLTQAQGIAHKGMSMMLNWGAIGSALTGNPIQAGALLIASKGPKWILGKDPDGVTIFLMSRAGRELSAGIAGHRGSVVGEAGNATAELKNHIRKWFGVSDA